jgi:hypothetical protein
MFPLKALYLEQGMKKQFVLLLLTVAISGCSDKSIDTGKVRAAFSSLTPDLKAELEQGLTAIDTSNYAAAIKPLEKVGYGAKMDKAQSALLKATLKKARQKADNAK